MVCLLIIQIKFIIHFILYNLKSYKKNGTKNYNIKHMIFKKIILRNFPLSIFILKFLLRIIKN